MNQFDYEQAKCRSVEGMRRVKSQMNQIVQELKSQKQLHASSIMKNQSISKSKMASVSKISKFEEVVTRPTFVAQVHTKEEFNNNKHNFIDTGKALDYKEKEALIIPDRIFNTSAKKLRFACNRSVNKCASDFGDIPIDKMSSKDKIRMTQWESAEKIMKEKQIEEMMTSNDGRIKRQTIVKKNSEIKVFKPNNFVPILFEHSPSFISERPSTANRLSKQILLPRLFEKKVWNPNKFFIT